MSDESEKWGLVLPFLRDDLGFAEGVELGMLWETLKQQPDEWMSYCLIGNQDQILLAADRQGYTVVEMREPKDGWFYLHLQRREAVESFAEAA
jgi:hypothetical protein